MGRDAVISARRSEAGLTLVELLVAATVMTLLAAAAAPALSLLLDAHRHGLEQSAARQTGTVAMDHITHRLRTSTHVFIPNAQTTSRDLVAFSGTTNDDGDYYFGDTLFPRIDEDPSFDYSGDAAPGVINFDDDGDVGVDEGGNPRDDDEDGAVDEDPVNGIDDDGDGNIDEDGAADTNGDGAAGMSGIDDDGDGSVDEGGNPDDDDEDGAVDEDPLNVAAIWHDGIGNLYERDPSDGSDHLISDRVSAFTVTFEPANANHGPRYLVSMTMMDGNGDVLTFEEYVFPRNLLQRTGKRVR